MKRTCPLGICVCLFGLAVMSSAQDKIKIKKIDDIIHVLNPARPLKGTVQLEVEKDLTINPFDQGGNRTRTPLTGRGILSLLRFE